MAVNIKVANTKCVWGRLEAPSIHHGNDSTLSIWNKGSDGCFSLSHSAIFTTGEISGCRTSTQTTGRPLDRNSKRNDCIEFITETSKNLEL